MKPMALSGGISLPGDVKKLFQNGREGPCSLPPKKVQRFLPLSSWVSDRARGRITTKRSCLNASHLSGQFRRPVWVVDQFVFGKAFGRFSADQMVQCAQYLVSNIFQSRTQFKGLFKLRDREPQRILFGEKTIRLSTIGSAP